MVSKELLSFDLRTGGISANIAYFGYSKAHQLFYLEFTPGNRYIYKDVDAATWQIWLDSCHKMDYTPNTFINENMKGHFRYEEVMYLVEEVTIEILMDQYKKLLHHYDTTVGLWAVDTNPKEAKDMEAIRYNAFQITGIQ